MVMALAETSRNVEKEKTGMTNQQFKYNGKGKQQNSSGKLNPWRTFFKKSTTSTTLKRNDTHNETSGNDANQTNLVTRSSSVIIGNSRSNNDGRNNKNEIYDNTAHNKNRNYSTAVIPPSVSLYQVMKRENSFHMGMSDNRKSNDNTFSENTKEIPSSGNDHPNVVLENQIKIQAKKSASESDLLGAEYEVIHDTREEIEQLVVPSKLPQVLHNPSNDTNKTGDGGQFSDCANNTRSSKVNDADGFYRSFDDDIDDIDFGVLADSNSLEASIVLRNQPQTSGPYISNPSGEKPNNVADSGARFSFNSSCDSGRASDTYAETSNSSVTSGFSNRLYSNTSNCSGDSGAQLSFTSDTNSVSTASSSNLKDNTFTTKPLLEALAEQESPINTATFKTCEKSKSSFRASSNKKEHNVPCELENSVDVNNYSVSSSSTLRNEKDAYNDTQGCICIQPCICYSGGNVIIQDKDQHKMEENVENNRLYMQSTPVLGPRFATVRKSLTLPHDINNIAFSSAYSMDNRINNSTITKNINNNGKMEIQNNVSSSLNTYSPNKTDIQLPNSLDNTRRKDLSRFLGLKDEGPGTPSKKVAHYIAMQNYQSLQGCQHKLTTNEQGDSPMATRTIYGSQKKTSNTPREICQDPKRKDIENFLGIKNNINSREGTTDVENGSVQRKPTRPKSLMGLRLASSLERRGKNNVQPNSDMCKSSTLEKDSREFHTDLYTDTSRDAKDKNVYSKRRQSNEYIGLKSSRPFAVNRTLTRFQNHFGKEKFHSAPTTPECVVPTALGTPPNYHINDSMTISPRRKNLDRFLGLNNEHYRTLHTKESVVLTGILQKKRLYSSTPDELESSSSMCYQPNRNDSKNVVKNEQVTNNDNVSTIQISTSNQPNAVSSSLHVKEGATHISIQSGSMSQTNSAVYANRGLVFRFTPSQRSNSADRSQCRPQHSASIITVNSGSKSSLSTRKSSYSMDENGHRRLKENKQQKSGAVEPCKCETASPSTQTKHCSCSRNIEWRRLPSMSMDRNFKLKYNETSGGSGNFSYSSKGIGVSSLPRANYKCTPDTSHHKEHQPSSNVALKLKSNLKQTKSLFKSSMSQDSIKFLPNNDDNDVSNIKPISIRPPCEDIKSYRDERTENNIRRNISIDNISVSPYMDTTSTHPCYPYEEPTTTDQEIYALNHSQQSVCCKRPTDVSGRNTCSLLRHKTDSSACSCICSHHRCLCSASSIPTYSDYPNAGSVMNCDHHRHGFPSSELNTCLNPIPVIICRPEHHPDNNILDDSSLEQHLALHSNMYAVPLIHQSRCACLAPPAAAVPDFGTEEHKYYDLYNKVSNVIIII